MRPKSTLSCTLAGEVDGPGLMELHGAGKLLRQAGAECLPGGDDFGLRLLVEQAQSVPGLDVAVGETQERPAIGGIDRRRRNVGDATHHGAIALDLVRRHKVHAFQQGIVGREIAEKVDQGLGDPEPHADKLFLKARLGHDGNHIGMVFQPRVAERFRNSHAEDEVLPHRGVDDIAVRVEHLDIVLALRADEPLAKVVARRKDAALQFLKPLRGHAAPEAEPVHVVLQVDHDQHLAQTLEQIFRAGRARGLVVDPVVLHVDVDVAGSERLHAPPPFRAGFPCPRASGAHGAGHRPGRRASCLAENRCLPRHSRCACR